MLLGEDLRERIRLIEKLEETLKGYHLEQEFQVRVAKIMCIRILHVFSSFYSQLDSMWYELVLLCVL